MKKPIVVLIILLVVGIGVFSFVNLTSLKLPAEKEISSAVIHNRMRNSTMSFSKEDSSKILTLLKRKATFKLPIKQAYGSEIKFIGEDGTELLVINVEYLKGFSDDYHVKIENKTYKVDREFYDFLDIVCKEKGFSLKEPGVN